MAASGGDNRSWSERMKDKALAALASKVTGVGVSGDDVGALKASFKSNNMAEVFVNVANLLHATAEKDPKKFGEILDLAQKNGIPAEFKDLSKHPDFAAAAVIASKGLDRVVLNMGGGEFQDNEASKAKRLTLLSYIVGEVLAGVPEGKEGVLSDIVAIRVGLEKSGKEPETSLQGYAFNAVDGLVRQVVNGIGDSITELQTGKVIHDPIITKQKGHLSVDKDAVTNPELLKFAVAQHGLGSSVGKRVNEVETKYQHEYTAYKESQQRESSGMIR